MFAFDFDYFIARDNESIGIKCRATAEAPTPGTRTPGITDVNCYDGNGMPVTLTALEDEEVLQHAETLLAEGNGFELDNIL
jgi:hypothetical protein